MIDDNQIYVVVDVENNGPTPGLYSMLAIGAVATTKQGEVSTFYAKIKPLENASEHHSTMKWWRSQPEAWREVCKDAEAPNKVILEFYDWINRLGAEPVFVAHPIAVDYTFVSWYLYKFVNKNPFEQNKANIILSLDIRSFISGRFKRSLVESSRGNLPKSLLKNMPEHSHNALDDAKGYAVILRNILR